MKEVDLAELNDEHFAILRRHMAEVIEIEFALASEETGRARPAPALREALMAVPRHLFVPSELAIHAYEDRPLPVGFDKTISQPFMSALMIDLLDLDEESRVLEVGTGLGYQTAILAMLAADVFSIEVVEEFATIANARLHQLGHDRVSVRIGDGSRGWANEAPFDAILVSAASRDFTPALAQQLKDGGRMVLPLGEPGSQRLVRATRDGNQIFVREIMSVAFTELETVF